MTLAEQLFWSEVAALIRTAQFHLDACTQTLAAYAQLLLPVVVVLFPLALVGVTMLARRGQPTNDRRLWVAKAASAGLLVVAVSIAPAFGQSEAETTLAPPAEMTRVQSEMNQAAEANKALIMRLYEEAWHNDNYAVADEIFAPDYIRHDGTHPVQDGNAPLQSTIAREVKRAVPDLRFTYEAIVADEEYVAVRWTSTGTPADRLWLARALVGKRGPVKMSGVNLFRIQDGQVVEVWNNRDDLTRFREAGLVRWLVVGGFLLGLLVTLIATWGLRRWRAGASAEPANAPSAADVAPAAQ